MRATKEITTQHIQVLDFSEARGSLQYRVCQLRVKRQTMPALSKTAIKFHGKLQLIDKS